MLPVTSNGGGKKGGYLPRKQPAYMFYLRRLLKPSQMDFNYAFWTLMQLILSPKTVYKQTSYQKQTKNQWARDDPAFVVISTAGVAAVTLIYCLIFSPSFSNTLSVLVHVVLLDYFALGCLMATIGWLVANKFLSKRSPHSHAVEQSAEWAYAFDVHCNSFAPLFLILGVGQLILSPILLLRAWLAAALSNILYSAGISLYFYLTFLGYSCLPGLENTEVYLYPIGAVVLTLPIALLVGFNPTKLVLGIFLGYNAY